jgi:purine nucleosidase
MGGAYRHPGNTAPTTEWNIHCDPEAASIAFAAWGRSTNEHGHARPVALGLDVTEKAKILPDHVVALAKAAGSEPDDSIALARGEDPMQATRSVASNPIVRYIADALRFYMEFHRHYDGFYGAFIHDPLAVAAALDPSLVTTQSVAVDVELAGTFTTGTTLADWRGVWGRPPNMDVATDANAEEFLRRFVERVGRLASARAS